MSLYMAIYYFRSFSCRLTSRFFSFLSSFLSFLAFFSFLSDFLCFDFDWSSIDDEALIASSDLVTSSGYFTFIYQGLYTA